MLLPFSANAQQNTFRQEFECELKSKDADISSIQCDFIQIRELSILSNVVKKEGVFYFQQPGNILLSFHDGDYIKMTTSWFEMKTGQHINKTKVSTNPMLKSLSSILSACIAGDVESMTKGFSSNVEKKENEWYVTMKPKRGKAVSKISQIVLRFDIKDMSLNSLKMVEKSGDYTMYSFLNKKFNVAINNDLFNTSK